MKKTTNQTSNKELVDESKRIAILASATNQYSRGEVTKKALNAMKLIDKKGVENASEDDYVPIRDYMSLNEFDNANFLTLGFTDSYRSLAVEMKNKFQMEYACQADSEKALAHLIAQSFVRALQIQEDIRRLIGATSYTDLSLKRLAIMEKALARTYNLFTQLLFSLRSLKHPPINVTVKTQTANIANQQIVQDSGNVKAK